MKTVSRTNRRSEQGAILAYLILMMVFAVGLASVGAYVAHTTLIAHRRSDMIGANQYAQGGAVLACANLNSAYMNATSSFPASLTSLSTPYTLNPALSTNNMKVYERTISSPFTNQTVSAQIWVPNVSAPLTAKVVASARVGDVAQTATLNLLMNFEGAAIYSVNKGTTSTSADKGTAIAGNVVASGGGQYLIIDGGKNGLAADANGHVNIGPSASVPPSAVAETNWGSANQLPDYTGQGTANSLFNFNRFIAVADLTPNASNTNSHNNHFPNIPAFANAIRIATNHTFEGVVVVDVPVLVDEDVTLFPFGINVRGTLFYNFAPGFGPTSKFKVTTDLNVNAANLSGLVATNPSTYTTGYPPVYSNPSNNPVNIDITSRGFANFLPGDDLPALMYSIGEVDIHGNANVCGVSYTPSYMEIENKSSGNTQYFKGMLIMGQGIYFENHSSGSTSIISYDRAALDNLATSGNVGKSVKVAYWQ
jgi:hypothetical protein